MARPIKDGIDYFPMDIDFFSDMKVRRIKKACGPASVSILICLLCNIYRDGYYISWNEDLTFFISEIIGVTEGVVYETILKAVSVGFFNGDMFSQHKILTSAGIQKRFMNVVKASKLKRNSIIPEYDLTQSSEEIEESSEGTPINSEETPINPEESTQRKVKQSKEKKSIQRKNNFTPPTLEEIKAYCAKRKNSVNPQKFYDFYTSADDVSRHWIDSKGNPVLNWKQKIITWEGRNKEPTQTVIEERYITQEEYDAYYGKV